MDYLTDPKFAAVVGHYERAKPYQPLVDALRPHIARFDKIYCLARSEDEAIKAVTED